MSVRAEVLPAGAVENGAYCIDGNVKSGQLRMLDDAAEVDAFYADSLAALDSVLV